jgi:hypothetical protein
MALGEAVRVRAGEYSWDSRAAAVLPNCSVTVEAERGRCRLAGAWVVWEGARGGVAGANLSHAAADAWGATVRVRGGRWRLADCDVRCEECV